MTDHPTRDDLDRFIRGLSTGAEARAVELHLVEGRCLACVMELRPLMAKAELEFVENVRRSMEGDRIPESEKDESFDAAFRHGERRGTVALAEQALGPTLLTEIERRPPAARRELILIAERYQLFGFSEFLSLESREQVFHDLARAQELAELGVEVARNLAPRIYLPTLTADQQAFALACLGNVRRVASDLIGADRAFQQALLLLEHGSRVSPVRAEVASLLGSLRIDQARYYEARNVLREARKLFGAYEFPRDEAKVLIKLADVAAYSGDPAKAVALLRNALPLAEATDDARLRLQAHHNLTYWMVDAGKALEALAHFEKNGPLYDQHSSEPAPRLRRRWLEGRIYAALGDIVLAIAAFEEVLEFAWEQHLFYEVAMVSLELALVHLREGRTAQVRNLAEEMTPIFRSQELHRHALAAMYLFRQAVRTATATEAFVGEVLRYLQRARNNPYLRFEPSPGSS